MAEHSRNILSGSQKVLVVLVFFIALFAIAASGFSIGYDMGKIMELRDSASEAAATKR